MWRKQPEPKLPTSVGAEPVAQPSPPLAPPPPIASLDRPKPQPQAERPAPLGDVTRLTPGILVKGELSGQATLYIDGEVQGSIRLLESDVTVGPNGRVRGDIQARELMVQGSVHGNLQIGSRILLGRSSVVTGDLASQRVIIEEGANFRGRVDMGRSEENRSSRSAKGGDESMLFPSVARLVKEDPE